MARNAPRATDSHRLPSERVLESEPRSTSESVAPLSVIPFYPGSSEESKDRFLGDTK